jgi:GNAT superfamily N-acetyltransferase
MPAAMTTAAKQRLRFQLATPADCGLIGQLAQRIWCSSYPGILSIEQIRYMLELMYAPAALERSMREGVQFELVVADEPPHPEAIGYLAWRSTGPRRLALDKCYLQASWHGRGIGQRMLARTDAVAHQRGHAGIELHVNRGNVKAQRAYLRHGYAIEAEVVTPIGQGFVMDDYRMFKECAPCR